MLLVVLDARCFQAASPRCCSQLSVPTGVAQCEDTCLELGREAREQAAREAAMQVEGFAIRQEYVKKANV